MRRACWLFLVLLETSAAAADLAVRVMDPQNRAIPGAAVSLLSRAGSRRVLNAGENGTCRFSGVPDGTYFVESEAPGFDASEPRPLEIRGEGPVVELTVQLGIARVRTSIVVTASGTVETTDEVSKALTVVDREAMDLQSQRSFAEALENVPGLRTQQLGGPGSAVYFKIRGLRNTDTAVLVDGLRLRDAAGTQADASSVLQDLAIVNTDRVEVLRGTGSSLYGTDATGGVVNIVTGTGGGRPRGSVLMDAGALGSVRGAARVAGGAHQDRLTFSAGLSHWNVMSGIDDRGPARNTGAQVQVGWRLSKIAALSARIYGGDSFTMVRTTPRSLGTLPATGVIPAIPLSLDEEHRYESGTPLPQIALGSATFLPATYNPDSTRAGRFFTGALTFTLQPSDRLGFTAQYQDLNTRRNYGDGPAGPGSQPSGANLSRYAGHIQTSMAHVDARVGRFQQVDAGYEYERESFGSRLSPAASAGFVSNISQQSNAVFAQDQARLLDGRLRLSAAFRAQSFLLDQPRFVPAAGAPLTGRTFASPPAARTYDFSAAYTIRQAGTKLRTHAGRGYRAPSLYERFGVYFSGASYALYGDPLLRPDRSSSIDAGVDQALWSSRIQLSAGYFYTRLNEVIVFDSSGAVNAATDPLGRSGGYRNTGGGIARGVESSAMLALTRSLQVTGAYTYTDARQQTPLVTGVWQTYEVPRHQYSATAVQRFSASAMGYVSYSGSSEYLASISGRAFRFHGPSRAHAGLSYRRPLADAKALRLYVKGDNIFNRTLFENGFRTPGATFTAGSQFEF